jgi:hypothetical protein
VVTFDMMPGSLVIDTVSEEPVITIFRDAIGSSEL